MQVCAAQKRSAPFAVWYVGWDALKTNCLQENLHVTLFPPSLAASGLLARVPGNCAEAALPSHVASEGTQHHFPACGRLQTSHKLVHVQGGGTVPPPQPPMLPIPHWGSVKNCEFFFHNHHALDSL